MARIASKPLAQLCRRMSTSLHAGIDVRAAWQQESQRGSPQQRSRAEEISRRVADGESVAIAMRDCDGFFPSLACDMVDVGEQSGHLDAVLLQLAEYYEHVVELRRSFLQRIAWPILQLAMGVMIVALLILILGVVGSKVDLLGLGLSTGMSLFIYFLGVFGFAGAVVLVVMAVQRGWFGGAPLRAAMSIPILGRAIQNSALSRFSMALGMAMDTGMDVGRALQMALSCTQNSYYTSHTEPLRGQVQSGRELHVALRNTSAFPDEYLDQFESGELAGTLPEVLSRLSFEYRDRAQLSLKVVVTALSIAIWVGIAALLVFVIIRLFITLYLGPINEALEWTK
jgi:type IV pilus assembly protein PilC